MLPTHATTAPRTDNRFPVHGLDISGRIDSWIVWSSLRYRVGAEEGERENAERCVDGTLPFESWSYKIRFPIPILYLV